mmetsp:Transcript_182/g.515  ORF Transcript_182/g.515 Transcript_182/m.515 type:complete len:231 (-) Transcript_182:63-755(-)
MALTAVAADCRRRGEEGRGRESEPWKGRWRTGWRHEKNWCRKGGHHPGRHRFFLDSTSFLLLLAHGFGVGGDALREEPGFGPTADGEVEPLGELAVERLEISGVVVGGRELRGDEVLLLGLLEVACGADGGEKRLGNLPRRELLRLVPLLRIRLRLGIHRRHHDRRALQHGGRDDAPAMREERGGVRRARVAVRARGRVEVPEVVGARGVLLEGGEAARGGERRGGAGEE